MRVCRLKPIFHLATLFARRETKTKIRQSDWLKLAGERIRREQVGSVPTHLFVRANKVAKWKIGFSLRQINFDIDAISFHQIRLAILFPLPLLDAKLSIISGASRS